MRIRDWLIPQDKIFFELIEKEFNKVVKASEIFYKAFKRGKFDSQTVKKIKKLEKECDQIVHEIFSRLNRTFITPIDHEDIGRLIIACDDLIDLIYVISQRIVVYKINGKNKNLVKFAEIVKEMIDETKIMVFKSNKLKQKLITSHANTIHQLENKADKLVIKNLKTVFEKKDIKEIIKEKEIYELMEVLTDKIEDFSDLIQGIVTKNL